MGKVRLIELDGVVKTLTEWGKEYGINIKLIHWRLKHGWDVKDAFTRQIRKMPRRLPQSIRKQKQAFRLRRKNKKTKPNRT